MDLTDSQLVVTTSDDADVIAYRTLNPLAIGAFIVGLLSLTAFAHILLWALPLVAIILAFLALREIHLQPDRFSGRTLALAGLALGFFVGLAAPSRVFSRDYVLYGQARQRAQEWLELVRAKNRLEAYELHLPPRQRRGAQEDLADLYQKSSDAKKGEAEFWSKEPLSTLLAAGDKAEVWFVGHVGITPDDELERAHVIVLDYAFRIPGDPATKARGLRLFLRRDFDKGNPIAQWDLRSVVDPATVQKQP